MKYIFNENMKLNLLVVCLCSVIYYGCCHGYATNENDTKAVSFHNETQESSSEFTSDEAWPKSQTEVMDGAIKVGKSKIGSRGGSKTGKSKIGSGVGSKTVKNKIGIGGGKSYHRYRYRNHKSYGSGPVPTYVLIIIGVIGGSLVVGLLAYVYWNYANETK